MKKKIASNSSKCGVSFKNLNLFQDFEASISHRNLNLNIAISLDDYVT